MREFLTNYLHNCMRGFQTRTSPRKRGFPMRSFVLFPAVTCRGDYLMLISGNSTMYVVAKHNFFIVKSSF